MAVITRICIAGVIAALSLINAGAQDLQIPNTFVSGTRALASEVNENFDAVAAEVNRLGTSATSLEMGLADLEQALSSLTAPKEQLACAAFSWPQNPGGRFTCVFSSDPAITVSLTLVEIYQDGWLATTIGGETGNRVTWVFERPVTSAD